MRTLGSLRRPPGAPPLPGPAAAGLHLLGRRPVGRRLEGRLHQLLTELLKLRAKVVRGGLRERESLAAQGDKTLLQQCADVLLFVVAASSLMRL